MALDFGRFWLEDESGRVIFGGDNGADLAAVARRLGADR
jgi:hypothetical protein